MQKSNIFCASPGGRTGILVTIQGRVPFRRHHMSRRARLGSQVRGSYSYHTRSLRRIRRRNDRGSCGRGGWRRYRLSTGGQAGGVPIRGELPSPKIGAHFCSRAALFLKEIALQIYVQIVEPFTELFYRNLYCRQVFKNQVHEICRVFSLVTS